MQHPLVFIILVALPAPIHAQVNYTKAKNELQLSCGIPDTAEIMRLQLALDSIEQLGVSHGQEQFAYDLGWVRYLRYLNGKQNEDLKEALWYFEEAWEKHARLDALWNLGMYHRLGDCSRALDFTELYLEHAPPEDVDYQQVYLRYRICRGKEVTSPVSAPMNLQFGH